jgi:predicted dehydrogenase
MDRRHFLRTGGTAALALTGLHRFGDAFAETRLRVGVIGAGWYGKCSLFRMLQVAPVEVVSLCDVDAAMLDAAAARVAERQQSKKRPRTHADYRKMLAERDLDVVLVATPDHWHALAAIEALRSGCDVYLEKPISVDVVEGQAILAAARKYGRVVQVNTQRRSTPHLVTARREFIESGRLGRVGLVEIYSYGPGRPRMDPPNTPPPATLDWEMWTGPAPMRPFNPMIHPIGWRAFMEYGNGIVGDMCIHMLDMVRWLLDLGMPRRISSSGGQLVVAKGQSNITDTQVATFDFGELPVVWTHRRWGGPADPDYPWGATIYGEKATLKASVMRYDFTPLSGGAPAHADVAYELDKYPEDRTEERLEQWVAPALRAHVANFFECVRTRQRPVADIEQGFQSTTACLLANLSLRLGRTIEWDHAKQQVVGDTEANALLRRPYRAPWVHPEPDKV